MVISSKPCYHLPVTPAEDQDAEQGAWLQTMCEQFNAAHPNWDLTFEYGVCPEGEAKATVTTDVEAAADVYMFANDNLPDLVAANGIAELGGAAAEYVQSTNSQAVVDSVTYNGGIYGVPFTTNTWYMYYDKSAFTEEEAKSHLVKAMVFPVVMYGCESWTINKAEHQRIHAFELWCWRRLL